MKTISTYTFFYSTIWTMQTQYMKKTVHTNTALVLMVGSSEQKDNNLKIFERIFHTKIKNDSNSTRGQYKQ